MVSLEFALVDVFAGAPLAGNPLAVVADADRVSEGVLRAIAGEFNQPETTFVLSPRRGATVRLRSFTAAGEEVVGAGHNALGAWWWLAVTDRVPPGRLTQELGDRVLGVEIARDEERVVVRLEQARPELGAEVDVRELAAPLGLEERDLEDEPARVVSTGAPHLLVGARDRAAVKRARPRLEALKTALTRIGAQGCYLYALDPFDASAAAHARFFNPTVGLWEDPATGSAAGPLAWWLASRGRIPAGRVAIEQGHALARPSQVLLHVDGDRVVLAGSAVLTADGHLHVPLGDQDG